MFSSHFFLFPLVSGYDHKFKLDKLLWDLAFSFFLRGHLSCIIGVFDSMIGVYFM